MRRIEIEGKTYRWTWINHWIDFKTYYPDFRSDYKEIFHQYYSQLIHFNQLTNPDHV